MPADVDAPDKIVYGLTARQLATLAGTAAAGYTAWHALHRVVPAALLLGAGVLLAGITLMVTLGRRDGLGLDVWLGHAIRYHRRPRTLTTTDPSPLPAWVQPPPRRVPLPGPLRLPADAVDDDGEITLTGSSRAAIVAATTVNLALKTPGEQAAVIDAFGRWLNSLHAPTQIVVANRPIDLHSHAAALTGHATRITDPALAAACADHAAFLTDLAERHDPLNRQVLITTRTHGPAGLHDAARRADDTAQALAATGVTARRLDGLAATLALAGCADPYRPPRAGLAAPGAVITSGRKP
jgi:hypothetical protein